MPTDSTPVTEENIRTSIVDSEKNVGNKIIILRVLNYVIQLVHAMDTGIMG